MSQEFIREFSRGRCVCGCGQRAVQRHHVITRQELRRHDKDRRILADERNLVDIAYGCHADHHSRKRPLPLHVLPDSVFDMAAEVMGAGLAYYWLARTYSGLDMRHERMLDGLAGALPLDPIGHMQARQIR